jgi:N-acetylglucosaminyl-diphospho-decaprenol L-rhamnosyltransferase
LTSTTVTVAVISWNTRELLLRCLRSLGRESDAGRADVWVLDNGSSDGSANAARLSAPWAHVADAGANLGFGRAVNVIARQTTSPWLMAVNADVALEPGALEAMLAAGADERVGCIAPRLVLPDGGTQHSVHPFPTIPLTLAFNLGIHQLSAQLADRLCLEGFWDADRPRAVPWAVGACLLLRRTAFEDVGGFDERQWMYAEDLDLGWRLWRRGWITRYEPAARVLHESGAATVAAFGQDRAARFMAATYALLMRRRGAARTAAIAALNVAGALGRLAWMLPLARFSTRWAVARDENVRWLKAHLSGFRSISAPANPR